MNFLIFQLRVSNSKEDFYKNFRVSNSKCDIILGSLVSELENFEPPIISVTQKKMSLCYTYVMVPLKLLLNPVTKHEN